MAKKFYSAPVVRSEDVVLGVFGDYNKPHVAGIRPQPMFSGWGWIFRFMRWK